MRGSFGTGGTLDDAIDELQELVALAEISNDLQRATHAILIAHAAAGVSGSGPSTGGGGASGGVPGAASKSPPPSSNKGFIRRTINMVKRASAKGRKIGRVGGYRIGKALGMSRGGAAGLGKAAGAVGGAVGGVAGGVTAVAGAFVAAYAAVTKWTDAALNSARHLAQVSGSMAAVMAERDIRQMQRDVRRGESTASSAQDLMRAESDRKDAENRIGIVIDNVKNTALARLNEMFTPLLEDIADWVEEIAKLMPGYSGKAVDPSGLAGKVPTIMAEADKIRATGRKLMDIARDASRPPGVSAPMGSAPLGTLPPP